MKIQENQTIYAVIEWIDLGYFLISLHGSETSAEKAKNKHIEQNVNKYYPKGKFSDRERVKCREREEGRLGIKEFPFDLLFGNF
jgi:hypothetical protein